MRLTRRGWAVVAAVLVTVVSGGLYGPRQLDAVAVPGVVALAAAAIQVHRGEPPRVVREAPEVAHRGDVVEVRLRFDVESAYRARVLDHLDFGLASDGNDVRTTVSSKTVRYDLECVERGEKRVGPTRVELQDVLGLLSRGVLVENADSLTVRPRIYPLAGRRRRELLAVRGGDRRDRQEFEHLRDYDRGDALRDVHWKSSAKQPDDDLIVKEFTSDDERRTVVVAVEAPSGSADDLADAAASVVVDLLDEGFQVGLQTPHAGIEPSGGSDHRDALLDLLARMDTGQLRPDSRDRADVLVAASNAGVTVTIDGRSIRFEELAMTSGADAVSEVTAA